MLILRAIFFALVGMGCLASFARAQAVSRVEAALADLAADGRVDNHELFLFDGCPQDDPAAVAVFEAVRDVSMDPWGLADLAGTLTFQVYPSCGYAPLHEWYIRVLETLRAEQALGPGASFVIRLGLNETRLIDLGMQEALIQAAEDPTFLGGRYEEDMVRIALTYRPRELWIGEALAAFRRAIPRQSITFATYQLSREFGAEFYERVAAEADGLSDEAIFTVIRALGSEVQDGRADPDAAGLEELRALSEARLQPYPPTIPRERREPFR